MQIEIDRAAHVPIHEQIKEQILGLIHAGQLKASDQLPTMRALSTELDVNFNTVALAYHELDAQGIITTRRGEGTFVAFTPGEDELRALRKEKLDQMVRQLIHEAARLGYSQDELKEALGAHLAPGPEEK